MVLAVVSMNYNLIIVTRVGMDISEEITVEYLLTDTSCKPIIMMSPTDEQRARFNCTGGGMA